MKVKNNLLRILALVLVIMLFMANVSTVLGTTATTEGIQKSFEKYFNKKIIIKGSDNSTTTYETIGDSILVSDSNIKFTYKNKEHLLFDYALENDKITFTTNFDNLYNALEIDTSKIKDDQKVSYASILVMLFMENMETGLLATASTINVDNSLAYTYLMQNIIEKMYNAFSSENKIENIEQKTDIVSLQINNNKNILTTGIFTVDLEKLSKLSNSNINTKGTTYRVYLGTLPESEKTKISEYKDSIQIKSAYTYTGKPIKPSIKNGFLEKGKDFKDSYLNNTKIGKATMIITGIGDYYKGTFKKTFKIVPKGTTISKVTKAKKAFTIKWKKQKTQTTGYQIQYSTDKYFLTGKKTITITKNKTTSSKITKLKSNKKYYVRIRTYKNVKGTKFCSSWSKVKSIKTK